MKTGTNGTGRLGWSLLAVAVLCSGGRPAAAQDAGKTYELKYKFQPNQVVYYEVDDQMKIDTVYDGKNETAENRSNSQRHYRVVAVAAEEAVIEIVLDRVKMQARQGDGPYNYYDSTRDEEVQPQYKRIAKQVGKAQDRIRVAFDGTRIDDPLEDRRNAGLNTDTEDETVAAEAPQSFLIPLPKKPVAIGESWTVMSETDAVTRPDLNLRQTIRLQRKNTLVSVEGGVATIKTKTVVVTPVKNPQVLAQLIQQTPEGTATFDIEAGLLLSVNTEIDATVVGGLGKADSSLKAVGLHTERMITPAVAEKEAAAGSVDR